MAEKVFNPEVQKQELNSRLVVGLERISEVFRVLLWDHAKRIGLSPIQIQLLIFLDSHSEELRNVSHLAKEFNMTKATISDAIKILGQKELVLKLQGTTDARSYSISLTEAGKKLLDEVENFSAPLEGSLGVLENDEKEMLYRSLTKMIYQLNRDEIIKVQRTCYGCKFHEKKKSGSHCLFINKDLKESDIRLDCSDFIEAN